MNKSPVQKLFDHEAAFWDERYKNQFYLDRHRILKRWLNSQLTNLNSKALDVGCATFLVHSIYEKMGIYSVGVDVSEKMIQLANHYERNALIYDGEKLPFRSESFEYITVFNVIEFVRQPEIFLKELSRVSKLNARMLITIVNDKNIFRRLLRLKWKTRRIYGDEWQTLFDAKKIEKLLNDAGFNSVQIYAHSMPTLYEKIFSKFPLPFIFLFRNKIFSDCIYVEAIRTSK